MRIQVGGGDGALVVKLAGIAGGVGLYWEEIEAVARAGFRVAALDTAGDRRDDPAPTALNWDFLASEIFRGLDALDARRATLWGTSFGCLVALAAAARRPDRISGLLLCHPPAPEEMPRIWSMLLRWASHRADADRATRLLFVVGFNLLVGWEFVHPAALRRLPRLARAASEAGTPSRTVREKLDLLRGDPPGLPPADTPIRASLVACAWDTIARPRGARNLAHALRGSRLRLLPRSGHGGAFSRPRAHAQAVIEELAWITAGDSASRRDSG